MEHAIHVGQRASMRKTITESACACRAPAQSTCDQCRINGFDPHGRLSQAQAGAAPAD